MKGENDVSLRNSFDGSSDNDRDKPDSVYETGNLYLTHAIGTKPSPFTFHHSPLGMRNQGFICPVRCGLRPIDAGQELRPRPGHRDSSPVPLFTVYFTCVKGTVPSVTLR